MEDEKLQRKIEMDIQREKEEAMKNMNGNQEKGNPFGNSSGSTHVNNIATNTKDNNGKPNPRT